MTKTSAMIAFLLTIADAAANPAKFSSGIAQVAVIELYSSEGCSSCPPAEKWLGELRDKPGLWKDFVPMEFHVTFWNGLGWNDRLSKPEFTEREYAYASTWGTKRVYTPCFVRNGDEWRPKDASADARSGMAGELTVSIGDDRVCGIRFIPGKDLEGAPSMYVAHLALLGGGIASKVTGGENKGATLKHEFAVLWLKEETFVPENEGPTLFASIPMPKPEGEGAARFAMAAWVTRYGELEPIQATGGWLH
jgi:hypothetical protein